jgi:hypothetical protein
MNPAYPVPGMQQDPTNGAGGQFNMDQYWDMDVGNFGGGLNQDQQQELLQQMETTGMETIQSMITQTMAGLTPKVAQEGTFQSG